VISLRTETKLALPGTPCRVARPRSAAANGKECVEPIGKGRPGIVFVI
jgi:hypothetical protein